MPADALLQSKERSKLVLDRPFKRASKTYRAIRLLFKLLVSTYYNNILVENPDYVTDDGTPTLFCTNHPNSLMDAALLMSQIPSSKRKMLRLTAKSTQFGKNTFFSKLIEGAGTLPIQRPSDDPSSPTDNKVAFAKLIEALSNGDLVNIFPEGFSRYHPSMGPLKTGVARIASEVLTKHAADPYFKLVILTASLTYTRRERFRSNVLIHFQEPLVLSAAANPELIQHSHQNDVTDGIKKLTAEIDRRIRSGCLEAPSWKVLRLAHTARKLYAPAAAGQMSLGQYVRLTQKWVDIIAKSPDQGLKDRLKAYQDRLARLGLKDFRLLTQSDWPSVIILLRLFYRCVSGALFLLCCLPGLSFWLPIFLWSKRKERRFRARNVPKWDSYDEIAQNKFLASLRLQSLVCSLCKRRVAYGLGALLCLWTASVVLTLPIAWLTAWIVPISLLISLRFYESLVAAVGSILALSRLLLLHWVDGGRQLQMLRQERKTLHRDIVLLAQDNNLPAESREWLTNNNQTKQKARRRNWLQRRARDWNDSLTLFDALDNEDDDLDVPIPKR